MEDYPKRKHPRLKGYNYSQVGCYFITVCTKGRAQILSRVVGRDDLGAPLLELSEIGRIVQRYLLSISKHYDGVTLEPFVIMPNHVHLLLSIGNGATGSSRPTVPQIIAAWKRFTNRSAGFPLWQSSFHDHIIRDDSDFLAHWSYIDGNAARWSEDEYYTEI